MCACTFTSTRMHARMHTHTCIYTQVQQTDTHIYAMLTHCLHDWTAEQQVQVFSSQSNCQFSTVNPLIFRNSVQDVVHNARRKLCTPDCLHNFNFRFSHGQKRSFELNLNIEQLPYGYDVCSTNEFHFCNITFLTFKVVHTYTINYYSLC